MQPQIKRMQSWNVTKFQNQLDGSTTILIQSQQMSKSNSSSNSNEISCSQLSSSLPIYQNIDPNADYIIEIPKKQETYPTSADGQDLPIQIQCPNCQKVNITKVEKEFGIGTLIVTIILLFVFWPFFWIPCASSECRDIVHYCPNCAQQVGQKPFKVCQK